MQFGFCIEIIGVPDAGPARRFLFLNLQFLRRPDRCDPAVDFVGFRRGVSGGLLKQW
jgi:hypothetical protein